MTLLLASLGLLVVSGVVALMGGSLGRHPSRLAAGGIALASVLGCLPAVGALLSGSVESFRMAWSVPGGEFALRLDALSAWFLIPIFVLSALAAVYGVGYLGPQHGTRAIGASWLFYAGLVASMVLVVLAQNAVLFLVAWEIMAVTSFFLVTFEDENESVRQAGWIYLVATHLGTAFLLALFVVAARETGSTDFADWHRLAARPAATTGFLFVLAVIGFGAKAGLVPLHVWLPEAHPAAPSHVSALMSGVMIKTGIYGIVRFLTFLGPPAAWWGWLLIGLGLGGGVFGVLFALAQHDLKRLLAYHSVENIGIITLGLGAGILGLALNLPFLAVLGFAGGLLHVVNHALFKGLLFLGAGSVAHATGTREMDSLGGLLKRMPWTGVTFLVGAAAIAGLPPLNGFVSELLIFLGAYRGVIAPGVPAAAAGLVAIAGLALISGLAAACFAKAFGIVFLGEPRAERPAPHETGSAMRWPMVLLAAGCAVVGLTAPWILTVMKPLLGSVTGLSDMVLVPPLTQASHGFMVVSIAAVILVMLAIALALLRRWLLAGRGISTTGTWDCGYARPTARMQYTGSSFAQPFTFLFRGLLRPHVSLSRPEGFFPASAAQTTHTPDVCHAELFRPAFLRTSRSLAKLRWLQHGRVQLYVLYIALTLLGLLLWKLR